MSLKLSRNPQIAFEQGKTIGLQAGGAEGVKNGFQTGLYLALAGYYNTKPDDIVSDEVFGKWSTEAEAECSRIFADIRGDYDVTKYAIVADKTKETIEDNVERGMIRLDELRKHLGMTGL